VNSTGVGDEDAGSGINFVLLVVLIAIFSVVVGYGWFHLFRPVADNNILAVVLAALFTMLALLLAQYVGNLRARRRMRGDRSTGGLLKICAFYFVLFGISAFGTVNTAYYWFQGSTVLQEDIDQAQTRLRELDSAASELLGGQVESARRQQVIALLAGLRQEIVNPYGANLCGVGDNALRIIGELRTLLPTFTVIRGSIGRNNCDQVDEQAIYTSYERQALEVLEAQRDPMLRDFSARLAEAQDGLRAAEGNLAGLTAGRLDESRYAEAQEELRQAATVYSDVRTAILERTSPDRRSRVPDAVRIDIDRSMGLGSIFSLASTIWSRRYDLTTWSYIAAAIILDLLLVYFFKEIALTAYRRRGEIIPEPQRSDPQFLWVNPPSRA